jgi:hypothetical protein
MLGAVECNAMRMAYWLLMCAMHNAQTHALHIGCLIGTCIRRHSGLELLGELGGFELLVLRNGGALHTPDAVAMINTQRSTNLLNGLTVSKSACLAGGAAVPCLATLGGSA